MEYGVVLVWWMTILFLWAVALPVTARLCRHVEGRGAGFAFPLALLIPTLVVFWVGHLTYGPLAIAAGVSVLGASALVAGRPGLDAIDLRAALRSLVVFTAMFAFVVALRAVDPVVAGSEKFLDYGLLNALLRAGTLPPEDMWFAGKTVRYYYGGHLVAATLSRLTGIPPEFTYNLAFASFYATIATTAFELTGAIVASRKGTHWRGGCLGVFFVAVAGNLVTFGRFAVWAVVTGAPDPVRATVVEVLNSLLGATSNGVPAQYLDVSEFQFVPYLSVRALNQAFTEFPFFQAGYLGDLHAHLMSVPFFVLAAGLLFAYYRTPVCDVYLRRMLIVVAVPLTAGFVGIVNTWDFPSVVGLTWLTLVFAPGEPLSLLPSSVRCRIKATVDSGGSVAVRNFCRRLASALAIAIVVGTIGFVFAAPFFLSTASGRTIALNTPSQQSGLLGLLLVHGAFLTVFGAYLAGRIRVRRLRLVVVGTVGLATFALAFGPVATVMFAPLVIIPTILHWRGRLGYESVLLVAGAGLALLVEVVHVTDGAAPGRTNTVFKIYFQVWVLWGIAAGVAADAFLRGDWDLPQIRGIGIRSPGSMPLRRYVGTAFVITVLLVTSTFAGFAIQEKFSDTDRATLDGMAPIRAEHPQEAEAIAWIDNRSGRPTIVSAPATEEYIYGWHANPASSLTGVPTVAGWSHEADYRSQSAYRTRVAHVSTIFEGPPSRQVQLLDQYGVEYIYVGPTERKRYDDHSFDHLRGVSEAFENDRVTIYEVNHSRLDVESSASRRDRTEPANGPTLVALPTERASR